MEGYRHQWKIQEAEEENKKLIELLREGELKAIQDLLGTSARWIQAQMIREYVSVSAGHGDDPAWVELGEEKKLTGLIRCCEGGMRN